MKKFFLAIFTVLCFIASTIAQVTGSGVAGYITKWNTTSSVTYCNIMYHNANGIGINAGTSFTDMLAVGGNVNAIGYKSNNVTIATYNSGTTTAYFGSPTHAVINTGGADRMIIKSDGKVGIGSLSPSTRLTVKGFSGDNNVLLVEPYQWQSSAYVRICYGDNNHYIQATWGDGTTFYDYDKKFYFKGLNSENIEMKVDGKIYANEIEVVADAIPDYVFEKDYKLMSINDVKKYIENNKHLPGVPSANWYCENGMDISEFNSILLKKIEEMQLYIIELQEQIDALKGK